ncbi:MAG TPA: autotransporter-associated beta strand repeat-containing protein [Pirellulales bacterium]|nr:autotransporter-associated beta strand repeat-containing protein [Pirellulales bacterium]
MSVGWAQTNGTWIDAATGGLWNVSGNWQSGNIASGVGATADFSTLDITANNTVIFNGPYTLGSMVFGDTTPNFNWIIDPSTATGLTTDVPNNILTLQTSSGTPTITVNNQTATLQMIINGSQGLIKAGAGTLNLGGATATNTTTNLVTPTTATVASAAGLFVGETIYNNADIPAGTTITAISGTTITLSQAATVAGTVSTTYTVPENISGNLTVNAGTMNVTTPTGFSSFTLNAGALNFTNVTQSSLAGGTVNGGVATIGVATTSGGTYTVNNGGVLTVNGAVAGTNSFIMNAGSIVTSNQTLASSDIFYSVYSGSGFTAGATASFSGANFAGVIIGNGILNFNSGTSNFNNPSTAIFANYGGTIEWGAGSGTNVGTTSFGIRNTGTISAPFTTIDFNTKTSASANGGLYTNGASRTWVLGGVAGSAGQTTLAQAFLNSTSTTVTATTTQNAIYIIGSANGNNVYADELGYGSGSGAGTTYFNALSITKVGVGSLSLTDASGIAYPTPSGTTTVDVYSANGGVLKFDETALPTGFVPVNSQLAFGGGTMLFTGKSSGATTQTVANVTENAGGGVLIVDPNGGTGTTLTMGTLTATTLGGALNIQPASASIGSGSVTITTTSTNATLVNGIYSPRITYGTDWATTTTTSGTNYTLSGLAPAGYTALNTSGSGTDTNNSIVSGSGAITPASSTTSTYTLKAASTGSGQTLDLGSGNTLVLSGGGLLFSGSNDYSINNGTLEGAASSSLIVQQLGATSSTSTNLTINSTIADNTSATALTKAGAGKLTLTAPNSYTGVTYVNGGTLAISSNGNLGNQTIGAAVALNGGTLEATGGTSFGLFNGTAGTNDRAVTIGGGGGTFNVDPGTTLQIDGLVSTAVTNQFGPLVKTGSGTLILSGSTNNYGGATIISGGILSTPYLATGNSASGIGASSYAAPALVLDGGTLQYTGTGATTDRSFTLTTNGGGLDASGAGALVFSNTAPVVADSALAGSAANRTLTFTGTSGSGINNQFAGQILDGAGGTVSVVKSGASTNVWQLTNPSNTYSGTTTVSGGTLALVPTSASTNSIPSTSKITIAASAFLDVTGLTNSTIALGPTQTLAGNGTVTGSVNTSGQVGVNPGSHIAPGSSVGTLTISGGLNMATGSIYDYEFADTLGVPSGNDKIIVQGSGGLTINGGKFNLYAVGTLNGYTTDATGLQLINYTGTDTLGGALNSILSVANPVSGLSYTFHDTGSAITLDITGTPTITGKWITDGSSGWDSTGNWSTTPVAGSLPNAQGATAIFAGDASTHTNLSRIISLNGSKTVGTLTMSNPNGESYTIQAGSGGSLIIDNGALPATVSIAGTQAITAGVTLNGSTQVNVAGSSDTLTVSGAVQGAGTVTKSGSGTLVLGTANSYGPTAGSTGTTLQSGAIQVGNNTALAAGNLAVTGTATLQSGAAGLSLANNAVITGGAALIVDTQANTMTLSGSVSQTGVGTGALTKQGNGTLKLTGNSSYTGNTTISNGTLQLGDNTTAGSVAGNIVNNGALVLYNTNPTFAVNGNISGSTGTLTVTGGTPTLNGTNSFGGDTVLNGGTLTLGNSAALQGSTLNYNNQGGTISFGTLTAATLGGLKGSQNLTLASNGVPLTLTVGANNQPTTYTGSLSSPATISANLTTNTTGGTANTATVDNATGLFIGQLITGNPNVPAGTTITNIAGTTITMSANATAVATASANFVSGSLTKTGTGLMQLTAANNYVSTTVNGSGTLQINSTGSITNAGSVTVGGNSKLIVNGGSLTAALGSTLGPDTGTFDLVSGSAAFNGGLTITSNGTDGSLIKVENGPFSAASITIQRSNPYTTQITSASGAAAVSSTSGLVVTGSTANIAGSLLLGSGNSSASARVDGGSLTVGGPVLIGDVASPGSGRYSILSITSGSFTSTDTTSGVVLSAVNGAVNNGEFLVWGGSANVYGISFGTTGASTGTGYVLLDGSGDTTSAKLYVGAGGLTVPTGSTTTGTVELDNGTLYATADWSMSPGVAVTVGTPASGGLTIEADDGQVSPTAHNIVIAGNLTGSAPITKVGAGSLTLTGNNSGYSGNILLNAGNLIANTDGISQVPSIATVSNSQTVTINQGTVVNGGFTNAQITGPASLVKTGTGTASLSATQAYSGTTTINQGTLLLTQGNQISTTTQVILSGGTLGTSGNSEDFTGTSATLKLTANSAIDLGNGSSIVKFANSNGIWTGSPFLRVSNWNGTPVTGSASDTDQLIVGANSSGLNSTQLADIHFTGYLTGAVYSSANPGEVVPALTTQLLLGDVTQNSHVDAADIVAMESALTNLSLYQSSHSFDSFDMLDIFDTNHDGVISVADVQGLISLLHSGGGNTAGVPEPESCILLVMGGLILIGRCQIVKTRNKKQ